MNRILTLLHDPATLISIGIGFFILLVVILVVVLRNRITKKDNAGVGNSVSVASASPVSDHSLSFLNNDTGTPPLSGGAAVMNYNAMVFTEDGIKFKTIKENLITQIFCDPSMPKNGARLLCVEKGGVVKGYDFRDTLIASKNTAQRAWRATHCLDIVRAMFQAPATQWEKLNQVFMWVFCGGLLFLGIIALSRI